MENVVRLLSTLALKGAVRSLAGRYEAAGGARIDADFAPTLGLLDRLRGGETADVVILTREGLDGLAAQGTVVADSRVELVKSPIGIAVKAGAPKPDISSPDAVKRALLAAKSIAYSDSASGVYVSTEMFEKLGIADAVKDKARKIPATPVGEIVANGEAEIGFQQISELKPVAGIDIVGPLPDALQKITVFSAGIATVAREPEAGKALITFLASSAARDTLVNSGLEPIARAGN